MTTTRIPLVAQINVTIVSQAVTAAYGSAGDLVNYSAACSSVLLRNPGEVWPIEFKVGSGAWQRLEIYNTTLLGISLDTTTVRVRKALENSGSGLVQLDIKGLASTYLAGDDAVDLGGEGGGATSSTDLDDMPASYTGKARQSMVVNDAGDGLIAAAPSWRFPMVSGRYYRCEGATESFSTSGFENTLFLTRIVVTNPMTLSELVVGLPTGASMQNYRLGVYRVADDALSADLISDGDGEQPFGGTVLTAVTLTPGVYLLGMICGVPGEGGTYGSCRALSSGDDKAAFGQEIGADSASALFGANAGNGLFDYSYTYSGLASMPATLDLQDSEQEAGTPTPVVLLRVA